MELSLFMILALALMSAFFSGSETALFTLRRMELRQFSQSSSSSDRGLARMMQRPQQILVTILLGNLFANLFVTMISTNILMDISPEYGHFISIAVITPALILFCEIVPKITAYNTAVSLARIVYYPLTFVHFLFLPFRMILSGITEGIVRLLKLRLDSHGITEMELRHAVKEGEAGGVLEGREGFFINNVMRFSRMEASEIMFPRNRALFIPAAATVAEAVRLFREHDAVRAPVYDGDADTIIGLLDMRSLLASHYGLSRTVSIKKYIQEISFFPATRSLNDILGDFLSRGIQMAVLIDEYGGTAGVLTLNAILATIMGKDYSSYDISRGPAIRKREAGELVISGKMLLDDFNAQFGTSLVSVHSDSIGGYFTEELSRIPVKGDSIAISHHKLTVVAMKKRSIEYIAVESAADTAVES